MKKMFSKIMFSNLTFFSKKRKIIFVDITELCFQDAKTGIQRVVRNITKNLLLSETTDIKIEPVYVAKGEKKYRYARKYCREAFLKNKNLNLGSDDIIFPSRNDIFLVLDLTFSTNITMQEYFHHMRAKGVKVYFLVYDILCILKPKCFPDAAFSIQNEWLQSLVLKSDGAICISKTVAKELNQWALTENISRIKKFKLKSFLLGSDFSSEIENEEQIELTMDNFFLSVGTLEPRKGYAYLIKAFHNLWLKGNKQSLVIVGKNGWMMDDLASQIRSHPQYNKKLFWYTEASDVLLKNLYQKALALILPSEGEGFGLPIIEAAHYGTPLILSDIPVFKEVAGENAEYFPVMNSDALARKIKEWSQKNSLTPELIPQSKNIKIISWAESTQELFNCIMEDA